MYKIFKPMLNKCMVVYINDILVYSKNIEEHIKHLYQVLNILQVYQLYSKILKYLFFCDHIEFLSYIVSASRVATDPVKTKAI